MIKLSTPYGSAYLLKPDMVIAIGSRREIKGIPVATREVFIAGTKNALYIADTEENMQALLGDGYTPEKPVAKVPKKKRKIVYVDEE